MAYIVIDQWPHREVAAFGSLSEAQAYIKANSVHLAMPIIVSRKVAS